METYEHTETITVRVTLSESLGLADSERVRHTIARTVRDSISEAISETIGSTLAIRIPYVKTIETEAKGETNFSETHIVLDSRSGDSIGRDSGASIGGDSGDTYN